MHWRRKWQPTPVLLPGESQGRGRTESDTTEVTAVAIARRVEVSGQRMVLGPCGARAEGALSLFTLGR